MLKYGLILLAGLVVVSFSALFTVDEREQAIIIQFGEYQRTVKEPGLHVKLPFVQNVQFYEDRLLRYDTPAAEYLTRDKKALVVDTYARYRIDDPLLFFQTMRDAARAQARLDAIISSTLREAVASHDQSEIITEKREPIMADVLAETRTRAHEFGVEVQDVRVKRTDFPSDIAESIYARMRAERTRISNRYRSEGAEEQAKIKAEADKERTILLAEARKQAETIRGRGDAQAIRIFAQALEQDPEFYDFYKSLQVYRDSLTEDTNVVLSADSSLFKYLEGPGRAPAVGTAGR